MGLIEHSAGAKSGRDMVFKSQAFHEDDFYKTYDKVIANLRALKNQKNKSILQNELRKFDSDIKRLIEKYFNPTILDLKQNRDAAIMQQIKEYEPKLQRAAQSLGLTILRRT
jgi:hypothetical protein